MQSLNLLRVWNINRVPSPPRPGDVLFPSLQPSQALTFSTFTTRSRVACATSSYTFISTVLIRYSFILPLVDDYSHQLLLADLHRCLIYSNVSTTITTTNSHHARLQQDPGRCGLPPCGLRSLQLRGPYRQWKHHGSL